MNCNAWFPLTKPNRKFCCSKCKDEFGQHGSAFGPLKTRIETMMKRHTNELREQISKLERRVSVLESTQINDGPYPVVANPKSAFSELARRARDS